MIPEHRKPKWVFTPATPPKRTAKQEEGVPLHQIDRRLWPGMTTVWYDGPACARAGERRGGGAGEQAEGGIGERDFESVPAAGAARLAAPTEDAHLCVSASLCENTHDAGASSLPELAPNPDPAAWSDNTTADTARTDKDVYPTEKYSPLPECVTSRSKKTLPECFALAESRPKRRSPTEEERKVMLEALLQREMPTDEPQDSAPSGGKARTGRPPKIVGQRRKFLLHALGLGLSRSEVARRLEISPATITKLLHRETELAKEVEAAERDGISFNRIYDKIFLPGCMVLERRPQLGTLYFEQEKEYLIAKGLPAGWVRRLRARDLEELCEEMNAARAREKALARVEKEYAKWEAPERKSNKVVKIVRREFIKANGQPREEIRWTVEQRGPGRPSRSAWKELEGLPEL